MGEDSAIPIHIKYKMTKEWLKKISFPYAFTSKGHILPTRTGGTCKDGQTLSILPGIIRPDLKPQPCIENKRGQIDKISREKQS